MKPLSQLLAEVEPEPYIYWSKLVDRAEYNKIKAIAVELAKCVEIYANATASSYPLAKDCLTTARKMLGEK